MGYILVMVFVLFIYYVASCFVWGRLISKILPIGKATSFAFGFLSSFYLSSFAIGASIVLWRYDRIIVDFCMILVFLAGFLFLFLLEFKERNFFGVILIKRLVSGLFRARSFKLYLKLLFISTVKFFLCIFKDKLAVVFCSLLFLFCFFIFHGRTGVFILSPWDALSSFVLILFFALCFISVKMIFSNRKSGFVLTFLIIFSYAYHLYLPAVYQTGFGGDKWRHLAAEKWLQDGNIYTPSVWGEENRSVVNFGPVQIPEALVAGNKTSYANQWGVTIMISEALGVSLFLVDLLMVFLLWSLFLPLILFLFGKIIFENERLGLLFAFLPALFYTFQSEGGITIPVSFGHLFFFFVLLSWMWYAKSGWKKSLYFAIMTTLAFYWGYILNFFVLIIVCVLSVSWRKFFVDRSHWYKFKLKYGFSDKRLLWRDRIIFVVLIFSAILFIPFLEIFQGLSFYSHGSLSPNGVLNALADSFGRLSGFIGIIVPPDFIDQGNFLYNQTKESLSRLPLFSYKVVPFAVSMIVWIIIAYACYFSLRAKRKNVRAAIDDIFIPKTSIEEYGNDLLYSDDPLAKNRVVVLIFIIFAISILSYFISWSFTDGVHILARRLNETIVFFMILFLGYGIWIFLSAKRVKIPQRKKILAICFFLAFSSTSTYASGPKLQMVTSDEIVAAEIVWSELEKSHEPYCVIANTWSLLGLESVSGKRIVGGNFPVYKEYAQPERVKIFEGLTKSPSLTWIDKAFRITGARECYYMLEAKWTSDVVLEKTIKIFGEPKMVGKVFIWKIKKEE